jgi:hypothetical protein
MRYTLAILIFLAGCASTPTGDVTSARGSWQDATYDDVVARWGTPVRSTKMTDGRDVYTWVSESATGSRSVLFPSLGIFGGSGGIGFGTGVTMGAGGIGGEMVRCERTLIFQNGRVADQTWQGPPDYCTSFRR